MSVKKRQALETIASLRKKISKEDFSEILGGLIELEPLDERDRKIESIWRLLEDVPMNPETERIEQPFWCFPAGTDRETIWHWFDDRHSKGVHYLLYELPRKDREQMYMEPGFHIDIQNGSGRFRPWWLRSI